MANDRAYDVVVFGATGFTGGLVAEYLAARPSLRWAIAGRDAAKLERVRDRVAALGSTPAIVIANSGDEPSLLEMARQTRVVLTTVGPYVRYGEPLVRACVEAATHYVDLTGEPPFVELVRSRYHARAVEQRVKIVNACGFDSIPHDLGAYFTLQALLKKLGEQERGRTPIAIEAVVRANGSISGGTWHSALEIMGSMRGQPKGERETASDGRKVGSLPRAVRFHPELGMYVLPMPTIDPLVVQQSARLLPEYGPDFRYGHYMGLKHWYQVAGLFGGVGVVAGLAQFTPTRKLLQKLKSSGDGPSEEQRAKSWFTVTFLGRAGEHKVRCEVRGGDPGYSETAKMISEAALCLAHDRDLPPHFGVVPSAAAFGNALIERLKSAGITFTELDATARPERSQGADLRA